MARVPLKLESWKQALAEGKPIVFGIQMFDGFDSCGTRGGVLEMPAPGDLAHGARGVHAMCAVGYNESEKVFIVRNCWGPDWGDGGYCYLPYDYALSPKLNDGDCWIFVPKVPSQPPRETWQDSTAPVTNGGRGVDFAIRPHTIADYDKIDVDLFAAIRRPFDATVPVDYADHAAKVAKSLFAELDAPPVTETPEEPDTAVDAAEVEEVEPESPREKARTLG
jgi:hypothetical protein